MQSISIINEYQYHDVILWWGEKRMSDICRERDRDVNKKDFDGKGIDLSNSTSPSCNSGELPTIQQDTKCNESNVRKSWKL